MTQKLIHRTYTFPPRFFEHRLNKVIKKEIGKCQK